MIGKTMKQLDSLFDLAGDASEVVVYSPDSFNQLLIVHPDANPMLLGIAAAKWVRLDWLTYLTFSGGERMLLIRKDDGFYELDPNIVSMTAQSVEHLYRNLDNPYDDSEFWKVVYESARDEVE